MTIPSYPKVYALGHRAIIDILKEDVIIQEKIDGSQFSFGFIGGELVCRSKGKAQNIDAPDCLFNKATEAVKRIHAEKGLHPEMMYSGEYLAKPKHNTLQYDRTPKDHIILFDIRGSGVENYMPYDIVKGEANRLGLEVVPLLFEGRIDGLENLKDLLKLTSILGGSQIEGVVVKNYNRFTIDGKVMMGKYVREDFKEKNSGNWKKDNPGRKDILEAIVLKYRNENRWEKAVQHLREDGRLQQSPRDIGELIKEVRLDIEEECGDEIKQMLFNWAWKQIVGKMTAGLPQWYKDKLLENLNFDKGE